MNYAKKPIGGMGIPGMPRIIVLTFHGSDADIVRSMKEETPIRAVGRIHSWDFNLGGGITLCPCELREYNGKTVDR